MPDARSSDKIQKITASGLVYIFALLGIPFLWADLKKMVHVVTG